MTGINYFVVVIKKSLNSDGGYNTTWMSDLGSEGMGIDGNKISILQNRMLKRIHFKPNDETVKDTVTLHNICSI